MHSFGDKYPQGAQLTHPVLNEYSQTDLLNKKLKRVTLLLSVMLIGGPNNVGSRTHRCAPN